MKKLVYILSLTIGLIMTGCTPWENVEPLSPDAIGSSNPELTVVAPDSITSDVIEFTITAKNASHLAYMVVQGTGEVDYTALLQGRYNGANVGEIPAEFEQTFSMRGAVPGEVYSLFVVAADSVGIQATFEKVMGAFDVESPYVTGEYQLSAANNGTRTTVTFNEAILRSDDMGAITYEVLDENFDTLTTGTATATASGSQLTVSLPSNTTFEQMVFVLLSFEEGAVEDLYGNKMAAIVNGLDDAGLPNGPWYMYDPNAVVDTDSFFRDGHGYAFLGKIDLGQGPQQFGSPIMPLTFVSADVTISDVEATAWTMPSILNMFSEDAISSGAITPNEAVPAYTYEGSVDGTTTEIISFYDAENGFPTLGTMALGQNGELYEVYAADYVESEGAIYPGWDFAVFEFEGNGSRFDGCAFIGTSPVIVVINGNQANLVAQIDAASFQFHSGDVLSGSYKVNVLDTPVALEKVELKTNGEKVFRFAK